MKTAGLTSSRIPKAPAGAQSIKRAVTLLRIVASYNEQGARLSDIARASDLHTSTAHRILAIFVAEGFITYDRVSRLYHLGIELYNLGKTAHQFFVRDRFRSIIERIGRETEDTVFLVIRSGNDALCIDRIEGTYPIRTIPVDIGSSRPLGIGAASLSLIAFLPPPEFEDVLSANASRYSQYRNLSVEDIRRLAMKSVKQGYVVSPGLFHENITSIGIPIFDGQSNVVASIAVSAISQRMTPKRRGYIYQTVKKILNTEGYR
ncbi:MAG: IclR family transcriptional regulator [Deltaproteobacteria bacterium]|nr:IclR family transcriptional regulator [Deltaproteobacteria bacterium]MBW1962052.1 IclR family transcriptional regulator [Deltaproteobacteria bacterium]MBW2150815.1 IclR family transcriptional regulator [Deltaproteobacteria bacterium]